MSDYAIFPLLWPPFLYSTFDEITAEFITYYQESNSKIPDFNWYANQPRPQRMFSL